MFEYLRAFFAVPSTLEAMRADLLSLKEQVNTMSAALDNLTSAVASETSVEASAVALIQGLSSEIKLASDDPQVQALADKINASSQMLAAAVSANTTPAPTAAAAAPTGS